MTRRRWLQCDCSGGAAVTNAAGRVCFSRADKHCAGGEGEGEEEEDEEDEEEDQAGEALPLPGGGVVGATSEQGEGRADVG